MYVKSMPDKPEAIIVITEKRIEYFTKFSGPRLLAITIAISAAINLERVLPKDTMEEFFTNTLALFIT
jgi:hypothetical protein